MRFPRLLTIVAILAVLAMLAACGPQAGPSVSPGGPSQAASVGTPSVLPVLASSEVGVGSNRVVFSLLDPATNRPVAAPDRTLSASFSGPDGATAGPVDGKFIWTIEDEIGVYAAHVEFPVAGAWRAEFRTSAPGKETETIPFQFDVKADTSVLRPGERAPSVDTPTVDEVGGDLARVSTDDDPRPDFYETSVAEALAAGEPFVVAFATPKFCQTAICGPTLDRLKPVAEAHPDVTFINVEPYELELRDGQLQPVLDANGQLQAVPAVSAFGLLSEPYIFVVDGDGKVRAGFEAVFAEDEIEQAIAGLG